MRTVLLVVALILGVTLYRPWRYSWAFGQDAGAARSADWKDKPCSKRLAGTLYDDDADAAILGKEGNRFFFPGQPGHSYFVHGFRSQSGCERARMAMGNGQWDQSKP